MIAAFLIGLGLVIAGAMMALGWLHWRGLVRFGRRQPAWGLGTLIFGALQVAVWMVIPGPPDVWPRALIVLVAAVATVVLLARQRGSRPT